MVATVLFPFSVLHHTHHIFLIAIDKQVDQSCLGFRRQKPSHIKAHSASSNVWNVHWYIYSVVYVINSRATNALSLFLVVTVVVGGKCGSCFQLVACQVEWCAIGHLWTDWRHCTLHRAIVLCL